MTSTGMGTGDNRYEASESAETGELWGSKRSLACSTRLSIIRVLPTPVEPPRSLLAGESHAEFRHRPVRVGDASSRPKQRHLSSLLKRDRHIRRVPLRLFSWTVRPRH